MNTLWFDSGQYASPGLGWTPKNESAHEETRVDHCTALGDVASRSGSRYPHNNGNLNRHNNGYLNWYNNGYLNRHNNRRYVRRGNGRDVLQRTHRPEHEWLWIQQRDRAECGVRIERRGWQQHVVHSDLPGFSAGERTVQLNQRARRAEMNGSALPEQAARTPGEKGMRRGRRGGEFAGSTDKLLLQGRNPSRRIFKACITIGSIIKTRLRHIFHGGSASGRGIQDARDRKNDGRGIRERGIKRDVAIRIDQAGLDHGRVEVLSNRLLMGCQGQDEA